MARTKQTARKTTGGKSTSLVEMEMMLNGVAGKAPRKQLAAKSAARKTASNVSYFYPTLDID